MAGDQTFITRKGYHKLHKDLEELKKRRPLLSAAIKEAREKGDLKENAEYHAAKEELAHNERRIQELEGKLSGARILEDQGELPTDTAYIGATVSVKDDAGEEMKFTLVDSAEAVAEEVRYLLTTYNLLEPSGRGDLRLFVSDNPERFRSVGERFLGERVSQVSHVAPEDFYGSPLSGTPMEDGR